VAATVREHTGGLGADVIFECAGVPASLQSAIGAVRQRGKIVLIGLFEKTVELTPNFLALNEITVLGHNGSTRTGFETVIRWIAEDKIPTDPWVHHVPFGKCVAEGFDPLRRGEHIKVLVDVAQR
jgi:(R,R)-butanediol dehydrogenase/meso-butanediol dehydrogenase/diacetyl reductase